MAAEKRIGATPREHIDGVAVWCGYDALLPADELVVHPKNNNTHPKRQVELLAKIIKQGGWRACITISNRSGFITKGHGRLLAADALGLSLVPVEYQDYPDEAAELADLLADNKIAQLAEFDADATDLLLAELVELEVDVELAGFDAGEIPELAELDLDPVTPPEDNYAEQYGVIVICRDEAHQEQVYTMLKEKELNCKVVNT